MIVRFGYVAISLELQNASPNKTTTVTSLMKLSPDVHLTKLRQLATQNLQNQLRILKHNVGNGIHVYRFTSNLIPLATHPVTKDWAYEAELASLFQSVGDYVKTHQLRTSFHPDHFVNLHSPNEEVRQTSLNILRQHERQRVAMGLSKQMKYNIHIGGTYGDKGASIRRFMEAASALPDSIRDCLTLENDDKTFTARETLDVCVQLGVPMVFDWHHHFCNREDNSDNGFSLLSRIFATWEGTGIPPKVHVSSPKGQTPSQFRSHADFLEPSDVVPLLYEASKHTVALDVMIEAKAKDQALFKLMDELYHVPGFHRIDGATYEVQ